MAILDFSKILKLGSSHLIRARWDVEDNSIFESLDRVHLHHYHQDKSWAQVAGLAAL